MKIKSLLIGSAAASMFAATGSVAQAADPIVYAEPEPMDYVRVCDVYGAGFFYIPGTETCLSVGGYVRFQVGAGSGEDPVSAANPLGTDTPNYHGYTPGGWNPRARARLNFDARSETEWGTLRAFARVQGDFGNQGNTTDSNAVIDQAYVAVGGLLMGYTESAWVTGGGSNTIFGTHSDGGLSYGYQQRMQIRYTFNAANGFFATGSLENNQDVVGAFGTATSYMPDAVIKAGVQQGWGAVYAQVGYDSETASGDSDWGVRGGVHVNVPNMEGSSFRLFGFYSSDIDNVYAPGMSYAGYGGGAAEWSVAASYLHQFTDTVAGQVGYQFMHGFDGFGTAADPNQHLAEASLIWEPVQNLEIRGEYVYSKATDLDGSHSGFVRFTRNF